MSHPTRPVLHGLLIAAAALLVAAPRVAAQQDDPGASPKPPPASATPPPAEPPPQAVEAPPPAGDAPPPPVIDLPPDLEDLPPPAGEVPAPGQSLPLPAGGGGVSEAPLLATDRLAAIVNQDAITEREILRELYYLSQIGRIPDPTTPRARDDLLDFWVGNQLMLQEAKALHVPVSDTEVNEELEHRLKGMSRDQGLLPGLYEQGLSISDIQKQIREEILAQRFQALQESGTRLHADDRLLVPARGDPTPQELRDYWLDHSEEFEIAEAVRTTYVAITKASFWSEEDALRFAKDLRAELGMGTTLEALRAAGTIPPAVQVVEGNFDWVSRDGPYDARVVDAAFTLAEGAWSPPVDAGQRLLILHAEEKRQERMLPFQEVQQRIATEILKDRRSHQRRRLVEKLRETAYVWEEAGEPSP